MSSTFNWVLCSSLLSLVIFHQSFSTVTFIFNINAHLSVMRRTQLEVPYFVQILSRLIRIAARYRSIDGLSLPCFVK